jgi:hypothetical protein
MCIINDYKATWPDFVYCAVRTSTAGPTVNYHEVQVVLRNTVGHRDVRISIFTQQIPNVCNPCATHLSAYPVVPFCVLLYAGQTSHPPREPQGAPS